MGKRFVEILRFLMHCVMEVIYPSKDECLICKKLLHGEMMLCAHCESRIVHCKESHVVSKDKLDIVYYSAAYYTDIITELMIRLKYKSDFSSGEVIAGLMTKVIKQESLDFDFITFVPMKRKEIRRRGYNQSEYLARLISREVKIPMIKALIKGDDSKDQIGLDGLLRWENLKGCFKAVNTNKINNKKILLVDDVITTGATGFYCASELLLKGAKEVTILTGAKSSI